jgi:ankyrin repeat protein
MTFPLHPKATILTVSMVVTTLWAALAIAGVNEDLLGAAKRGDLSHVERLLVMGADVNAKSGDGYTALMFASLSGHPKMVELLLSKGADVNASGVYGRTALICGVRGDPRLRYYSKDRELSVQMLLAKGADLSFRVQENGLAETSPYSNTRDEVSTKNNAPTIPLGIPAAPVPKPPPDNHKEIIGLLVARGADVNARMEDGLTALMYASYYGDRDSVELLLANGAEINARDNLGHTALMGAFGYRDIVELLLTNGADVNARTNDGVTALMYASRFGHKDVLELMIAKGANVNVRDNIGHTPYDFCFQRKDYPEIRKVIMNADPHIGRLRRFMINSYVTIYLFILICPFWTCFLKRKYPRMASLGVLLYFMLFTALEIIINPFRSAFVLFLFVICFLPIWIVFFIRKKRPQKEWIGVILSLIFGSVGQWYVERSAWYFVGLFSVSVVLSQLYINNVLPFPMATIYIVNLLSALIMLYRFRVLGLIHSPEVPTNAPIVTTNSEILLSNGIANTISHGATPSVIIANRPYVQKRVYGCGVFVLFILAIYFITVYFNKSVRMDDVVMFFMPTPLLILSLRNLIEWRWIDSRVNRHVVWSNIVYQSCIIVFGVAFDYFHKGALLNGLLFIVLSIGVLGLSIKLYIGNSP